MLSCAVRRCRGWLCGESWAIFFCYPCSLCFPLLDVTKITQLCPKLNIPTQWLVVRAISLTPTCPARITQSRLLFKRDPNLICWHICSAKELLCSFGVETYWNFRNEDPTSVMSWWWEQWNTPTHSVSYSVPIHPVRPGPKRGAVKHAVSVRALKSTITEDLDWII